MKKILALITLSFFINNFSYSFTKGKGEIKMSEKSIEHFINYIQGNSGIKKKPEFDFKPKPDRFVMSSNGDWTFAWYCPYTQCSFQDSTIKTIKDCERDTGVSCGVFASRRTIYWDNGTNTKTNKAKFKSKMSSSEIRAKLKEYGFIGQITKKVEKKLEKKIKVSLKTIKASRGLVHPSNTSSTTLSIKILLCLLLSCIDSLFSMCSFSFNSISMFLITSVVSSRFSVCIKFLICPIIIYCYLIRLLPI